VRSLLFQRHKQRQASRLLFIFENLNKAFGYLRNLIISWVVGFGVLSDLYFLAFSLASAVSSIITGAVGATFIPYSQKLGITSRRKLLGGSILATSALFFLVVEPGAFFMLANANPALRVEAFTVTGLLITQGVIFGFAATQILQLSDEFNRSRRNFVFGGTLLLIVNVTAIVVLWCGVPVSRIFLGWATALPATIIVIWLFFKVRLPRWDWTVALPYLRQTAPLMVSGSAGMVNVFIDRWFASGFDPGRLSLMQTSMMLVTQIGGAVVSPLINSAYPYFSEAYVNHRFEEAYAAVRKLEDKLLVTMGVFSTGFILLGQWILSLVYEHGAVHSSNVASLYATGCLYLPVFIYGALVNLYLRILYCRGEVKLPAAMSIAVIAINIMLNFLLVDSMGWRGLVYSASLCAWLYFLSLLLMIYLRKDYPIRASRLILMNLPAAIFIWELSK
jgi:putative peptidoglycan lipid II flippase